MNHRRVASVVIAIAATSAHAKPPSIPLDCGKASSATAERQYLDAASGGGDIYSIMITFTGKKPAKAKVEAAMRDCLSVAIKKDASKDILATAWFRQQKGASENDDVMLNPFGGMNHIGYSAASKSVTVHEAVPSKR